MIDTHALLSFGAALALIIAIGSTYEFVAIASPRLPTISRVVQGWRDAGGVRAVFGITLFCVVALGVFARWLWGHFLHAPRSST